MYATLTGCRHVSVRRTELLCAAASSQRHWASGLLAAHPVDEVLQIHIERFGDLEKLRDVEVALHRLDALDVRRVPLQLARQLALRHPFLFSGRTDRVHDAALTGGKTRHRTPSWTINWGWLFTARPSVLTKDEHPPARESTGLDP